MEEATKQIQVIRVGKYKRCSTAKQELILQEESLNKFIARLQEDNKYICYDVVDYADEGISGKTTDRPDLQRLLADIIKGKIDLVIFTKLDRLSRSLQDLLNTASIFKDNNVDFIVTEQNIDTTTPQGELLFQMLGAFAQFERTLIRERMRNGREKAMVAGSKSGKPCHRPKKDLDADGVELKFKKGMSMNQISKMYHVSITPIRRILSERGLIGK